MNLDTLTARRTIYTRNLALSPKPLESLSDQHTANSTASSSTLMEEYLEWSAFASALEEATISAEVGLDNSPNVIA